MDKLCNNIFIQQENGFCKVFLENEFDEFLLEKIRHEYNQRVIPVKASKAEISRLNRARNKENDQEIIRQLEPGKKDSSWESAPIINLVDNLLENALDAGASDIHIEPQENALRIRLRQDGMLKDFKTLPLWLAEPILIRLKILAEVDITDRRIPHDGSFTFNSSSGAINIRLSTLPTQGGEKCVLRLLPRQDASREFLLEDLISSQVQLDFLRKVFRSPQGLFLITGPTGSGKTTTLHAGLREIIHQQINVTTIEDPVEYVLEGANQVQVNERCGFTFPVALRSILRQDPDVILVGEIRDAETAQIAIRAAQTGHLVLSTLHTNNAEAAFSRLQDLGVETSYIQDSLLGVMAQRLVRKTTEISGKYSGRLALTEIIRGDGTLVDGNLRDSANRAIAQGLTDQQEIERIIGSV
ncbi:GspE/PulE family protein [Fibrobacter sp. UWEL]|uniref:GspE/PulE family protein n=1 Tax=Fibrobacter sp. UWEL TaxID=1896209 RepID=UPI00092301B9|nr:GspE/PulE family protein [Fibrobacter sp. UWEL]SHL28606.1 general secretion pathway protein E [Fibrobacter sp. UWEL]